MMGIDVVAPLAATQVPPPATIAARNEIRSECRKAGVMILRPAIFDSDVAPFLIASVLQTTAESHRHRFTLGLRTRIEKPNNRHRRLLRAQGAWPRRHGRRAAALPRSVMKFRLCTCLPRGPRFLQC